MYLKEYIDVNMHYYLWNIKYEHIVIAFVIVFTCSLLIRKCNNILWCFLYSLWMTFVLVFTMLGRGTGYVNKWTSLFASFFALINGNLETACDLFFNIVLFIPGGFLLRLKMGNFKTIKIIAFTSFSIEALQLITSRGVFEISDLMMNTLGGLIGICFSYVIVVWKSSDKVD